MYKIGTATDVAGVIAAVYDMGVESQINRDAPTLQRLLQAGVLRPNVDKSNRFRVNIGGGAASTFSTGGDFAAATDDTLLEGSVDWGRYERTVSIAHDAYVALTRGNPAALQDFGEQILTAMQDVAKKVNYDILNATGTTNTIVGLPTAIAASGTSYAGLVNKPNWYGNVVTSGTSESPGAGFALSGLRSLQANIAIAKGRRIGRGDFWIASPDDYNTWDIAQANEEGRRQVLLLGDARMNEGGLEGLSRDGAVVVEDSDCPAGSIYAVSSPHIQLRYLSPAPELEDAKGVAPFFWVHRAFTGNGHFVAFNVAAYVQLILNRRNAHGKYIFG